MSALPSIALLAILVGFAATLAQRNVRNNDADEIRQTTATVWTRILGDAARAFVSQHGRMPADTAELLEPDASGHPLLDELPPDPWGRPYRLEQRHAPQRMHASSAGPDGEFGSDDDIVDEVPLR